MSQTQRPQPRHLTESGQARRRTRVELGAAVAVVGALLLVVVLAVAANRATPGAGTRSASASSQPAAASTAAQPLSKECRTALAAANRMASHADAAVRQLRAHKKLMDDYKAGRIDRVAALPQGSPWRQALTHTLQDGVAAANQYDADKATYSELAAQCSGGG
jgi:hypothetical protein